jgi:AraC-like DNA-binding protein
VDTIDDVKTVVTWMRDNHSGFIYVSGVSHSRLLEQTTDTRRLFTILLILSIFFGLLIAILMALNSTRPIRALYQIMLGNMDTDEPPHFSYEFLNSSIAEAFGAKRRLESKVRELLPAQKLSLVYRILNSGLSKPGEIKLLGIKEPGKLFCVLIIAINDLDISYSLNEISAYTDLIDKAVAAAGQEYIGVFHNEVDKETLIIQSDREDVQGFMRTMEEFAGHILEALKPISNISVTFSASISGSAVEIHNAYYEAHEALSYKNRHTAMRILWFRKDDLPQGEYHRLMDRIIRYVNTNFANPQLSLCSVADEFGLTEFYLSRLFKEKQGINFSKYLEKTRVDYAQTLMAVKKYKVADAGREAGYNSYQTFSRAYRKRFGKSPTAYNNT